MADPKTPTEPKAAGAAPEPVECYAATVSLKGEGSEPAKPCICLFPKKEDAKKASADGKCVDVDPDLWKSRPKKYLPGEEHHAILQDALDRFGK